MGIGPEKQFRYSFSPPCLHPYSVTEGLSAAFKDFREAVELAGKGLYICPCNKGILTVDLKRIIIREILQFKSTN